MSVSNSKALLDRQEWQSRRPNERSLTEDNDPQRTRHQPKLNSRAAESLPWTSLPVSEGWDTCAHCRVTGVILARVRVIITHPEANT
jgi:hypothetical protein